MNHLHNVSMAGPIDLRARRRLQTSSDIHDVALRLARQQGFDNITVEQISAEAGISKRTFFNYFPTKESAVAYAPLDIPEELATEFVSRGTARHSVVLTDVISLLAQHLERQPPSRRDTEDLFSVSEQHPSVLAAMLATFEDLHASVAEVVAQRLGQYADEDVPQMIANMALATVRTGMKRWSEDAPADPDTPVPYVERAANVLRTLVGSDNDDSRPTADSRKRSTTVETR